MADTLSRIVGPVNIASGTSTIFTGTTAHVYTIKQMTIVNATAGAITVKLGIGGVTDALLIMPTSTIDAGGFAEWEGMRVLTGTQTLQALTSATGLTFTMDGLDQG
jgi:hypothetical protein